LKGGGRRTNLTRLYRRNLSGFLDAFKAILPRIQREATVRGRGSNAPVDSLAMAVPQMTAGLKRAGRISWPVGGNLLMLRHCEANLF
jgi:hypothetical protein